MPLSHSKQAVPHTSPFQSIATENFSTYRAAASVLLEDVRPEICSIGEILNKFSSYRNSYIEKYMSSFVSLSLLEVLKPLVLVDIMPVDILGRNVVSVFYSILMNNVHKFELSSRPWFQPLLDFCSAEISAHTAEYQHECDSYLMHKVYD